MMAQWVKAHNGLHPIPQWKETSEFCKVVYIHTHNTYTNLKIMKYILTQ